MRDKSIKPFIKYRKKELRVRIFKMSHFWWSIVILSIALGILIISFFLYECMPWLSGTLTSISCGCFTGLVFYFLTNIRNNKLVKLQKEYKQIKDTFVVANSILNIIKCYKFKGLNINKKDIWEDRERISLSIDELEIYRNRISGELYDIIPQKGYDPSDRDNLNDYKNRLYKSDEFHSIKTSMLFIHDELLPLVDILHKLLQEQEDQLMIMGRYFF